MRSRGGKTMVRSFVAAAALALSAAPAASLSFVNMTGQAVNDFHINLRGTGGALTPEMSKPWGMGVIVMGGSGQEWSGAALKPGQGLAIPNWLTVPAPPGETWPLAIQHPTLGVLLIDTAYWTKDGNRVGEASPRHVVIQPGTYVPEPGAWAMMIAGFGLVGSALRRRRLLPA